MYAGCHDDLACIGVNNCDSTEPFMMFMMVPTCDLERSYAFGRVFFGKIMIMGSNFVPGKKEDLYLNSIQVIIIPSSG